MNNKDANLKKVQKMLKKNGVIGVSIKKDACIVYLPDGDTFVPTLVCIEHLSEEMNFKFKKVNDNFSIWIDGKIAELNDDEDEIKVGISINDEVSKMFISCFDKLIYISPKSEQKEYENIIYIENKSYQISFIVSKDSEENENRVIRNLARGNKNKVFTEIMMRYFQFKSDNIEVIDCE